MKPIDFMELYNPAICFKGDSPNPDDYNKPTPQEGALAEVATNYWNKKIADGVPMENAQIKDVTGLESLSTGGYANAAGTKATPEEMKSAALDRNAARTEVVKGQANADVMQGMGPPVLNPTQAGVSYGKPARMAAKIEGDIDKDMLAQQAATTMGIVESAAGGEQAANTSLQGMASDAVDRNINAGEASYNNNASTKKSIMTLAGMGTQAYLDSTKKK